MAFVIVQHLDPNHKGMLAELLQRSTAMKVMQVKDRTRVQPDCVYPMRIGGSPCAPPILIVGAGASSPLCRGAPGEDSLPDLLSS